MRLTLVDELWLQYEAVLDRSVCEGRDVNASELVELARLRSQMRAATIASEQRR